MDHGTKLSPAAYSAAPDFTSITQVKQQKPGGSSKYSVSAVLAVICFVVPASERERERKKEHTWSYAFSLHQLRVFLFVCTRNMQNFTFCPSIPTCYIVHPISMGRKVFPRSVRLFLRHQTILISKTPAVKYKEAEKINILLICNTPPLTVTAHSILVDLGKCQRWE